MKIKINILDNQNYYRIIVLKNTSSINFEKIYDY